MRIACVGEAMIELSMTTPPGVGIAGDTVNTAVYLKRQAPNLQVDYVTRLGTDPFSEQIRAFLGTHNLGDATETDPSRIPGLYAITTDASGERAFTYWRSDSAARRLFQTPGGPDFAALAGYDAVYLSAITLAILPAEMRAALLDYLTEHKVTLAFDSNYRPRLWGSVEEARTTMAQWWARADICLPSIDDEMDLCGETAAQVEDRFLPMGKIGALKRGSSGPLSLGQEIDAQSYPQAQRVVDTTAAGDSFNGGYLAAHFSGESQAEALMAGHLCAARVVGFPGAIAPEDAT